MKPKHMLPAFVLVLSATAAFAYEGFDPHADPTLPTAAAKAVQAAPKARIARPPIARPNAGPMRVALRAPARTR